MWTKDAFSTNVHEGTNSMSEDYISECAVCHIVT